MNLATLSDRSLLRTHTIVLIAWISTMAGHLLSAALMAFAGVNLCLTGWLALMACSLAMQAGELYCLNWVRAEISARRRERLFAAMDNLLERARTHGSNPVKTQ